MIGCLSAGLIIGLAIGFFVSQAVKPSTDLISDLRSSLPSKGMQLADFELKDLGGQAVHLSQFKGHPIVVNFWASWCTPCKNEMPLLQSMHENQGDDLIVIGVNEQETPAIMKAFIDENHLTFVFLSDETGDVGGQYHVRALPTTFFLDADGVLQAQHIGQLNAQQLNGYLEKIGVSP